MRTTVVALLAALSLAACGGSDDGGSGSCTATVSGTGSIDGTYSCDLLAANYATAGGEGAFVSAATSSTGALEIQLAIIGQPAAGTYRSTSSNVIAGTGVTLVNKTSGLGWQATNGGSSGSFALTVTDVGSENTLSGGGLWPRVKGTLTGTLVPSQGNSATTNATVSMQFN